MTGAAQQFADSACKILRGAGWEIFQTVSEKSRARRGFTRAPAQSPIVQGPLAQLAERPEAS